MPATAALGRDLPAVQLGDDAAGTQSASEPANLPESPLLVWVGHQMHAVAGEIVAEGDLATDPLLLAPLMGEGRGRSLADLIALELGPRAQVDATWGARVVFFDTGKSRSMACAARLADSEGRRAL